MSLFPNGSPSDTFFDERRSQRPSRTDVHLSNTAYYMIIILGIGLGYGTMVAAALLLGGWMPDGKLSYIALLLGVFTIMVLGALLVQKSRNWAVSFMGYLGFVAGPFGALFGPFVAEIGQENIVAAGIITTCFTVILGLLGLAIKADLHNTVFADAISIALLMFVFISFGTIHLQVANTTFYVILACIGIVIFSLMIILDFNRAKHLPNTLDNAVDSSMFIFLSSLNLLLRMAALWKEFHK